MSLSTRVVFALVFIQAPAVWAEGEGAAQCRAGLVTYEIKRSYEEPEALKQYDDADCSDRTVYCVGPDGFALPNEEKNPHLRPGETLEIKLFGPLECHNLLTIASDTKQSNVTLFPQKSPDAGDAAALRGEESSPQVELLATTKVTPDANSVSVTIFVVRKDKEYRVKGVTLDVDQPRYFLDVGVLVAFTPYFQQVSTARMPGLRDQVIRETDTIRASGAVAVNYFPFGQYSQPRFSGYHGLGVQAAIGADFSRINDEFYLGLIWEPIPGAGISGGLALLEMQKLQPDYPSGALVQPNDVPKDTFLGQRFYFGVSLNTQVFQTVLELGKNARVPQ